MSEQEELEREVLREFLLEGAENLARMDQEMVELERSPDDPELLASIFRTIHTIKGTCGFFGFQRLESIAHVTENLLNDLRQGRRKLDKSLTSLILESTDAIKRILASIEAGDGEGMAEGDDLEGRLHEAWEESAKELQSPELLQRADAPPASLPVSDEVPEPEEPSTTVEPVERVPSAAEKSGKERAALGGATTLRIGVDLLDRIMNLVGELVLTRNQLIQYSAAQNVEDDDDNPLTGISQRFDLITSELQGEVMKTRMQPLSVVWNTLPRVVRDLATSLGKNIRVEMVGAETELDRTIIEAIRDPLTHIVRNSCDHGIESLGDRIRRGKPEEAQITLRAFHESGKVNIEVSDDGAGIDTKRVREKAVERGLINKAQADRLTEQEAIRMVFLPGFSTAKAVTNVSGRGVGMDVVKTNIERVGGTIDIVSRTGGGTTVKVILPLTLAIIPGLVVTSGGERFVIPQVGIQELIWLDGESVQSKIEYVHKVPVFRQRNGLLPLVDFSKLQNVPSQRRADELSIVVLTAEGRRFGLIVDSIRDTEEIVVKPLGPLFRDLNCYAGATIMGDGCIALILDVYGIGLRSGVVKPEGETATLSDDAAVETKRENRASMLLFRAGSFARVALQISQVARLEQIPVERVERAAGQMVVQYRDEILPLINVGEMLGGSTHATLDSETLEVIVCRTESTTVGLVVDEVMDAVDELVGSLRGSVQAGLLGSAVLGGQVTDILDLEGVIAWGMPQNDPFTLERLSAAIGAPTGDSRLEVAR
jgi:two-component system chemotaxis sensor kinase CheA